MRIRAVKMLMAHYRHLGFVDLVNVMQSYCRYDEEAAAESCVWRMYTPRLRENLALMNAQFNEISFESLQKYEEICTRESWHCFSIQCLLEGYITILYDTKPEAYRTFKEIRNIFVPDDERIKVRKYTSDLSGKDERERMLHRYAEFMRCITIPEGKTLFNLVHHYLEIHDEKLGFLAAVGDAGAVHLKTVERMHQQCLALFNRAYDATRDEMKLGLISPKLFSKLFERAEEIEVQKDQRERWLEQNKESSSMGRREA